MITFSFCKQARMHRRGVRVFVFVLAIFLSASFLRAQVGNGNPTGIAGEFSGDVTTGCDYTPFTSTARRSITDLVVAGGVGAYPLAFTRVSTSRYTVGLTTDMGAAGSWRHAYEWSIDTLTTGLSRPASYTVNFPNGGRLTFGDPTDPNFYGDPYDRAGIGPRERLQVIWDSQTAGRLYLILEDGGKVYFTVQRTHPNAQYVFTYTLQSIIDPYGRTTTVSNSGGVTTITEPAGRWIKLYYRTITQSSQGVVGDSVVDHVTASDGRSVQYNYTAYLTPNSTRYTSLSSVVYFGDATLTATYTYKNDNVTPDGRPLLSTCYDPMYGGPMVRIAYTYADSSSPNPDGSTVVSGQILSENYFDGTNVGPAVSTLTITGSAIRQETRGDGKTRTFTYFGSFYVQTATDFKGISASQGNDSYFYVNSFTDRNGNTTNWTNNVLTGHPIQITYPLTPNDTPAGTPRGTVTYTYGSATCPDPNNRDGNNPYYLYSITDEGGNTTVFLRDASKRITQVNYPDGGTESFTYNSFGQVLTHVLKTGGTESFTYDVRGLKQTYRDPYHATGNPTAWYQYDSLDRVSGVTDALGSAAGDINHTTSFTYNSRGQLLVTTLPVDPIDGQRHNTVNAYNSPIGTLASVTDQLGHVASFTYDDYRRLRSLTTPGHNTPVTAYSYYDANGTGDDYTLTYPTITHTVSPGGERITTAYDENRRKISVTAGDGTSDVATTTFGYDNNGNVTSVISPNEQPGQLYAGLSTVTTYDERNRPMSIADALGNTTTFKYDAAGRKASITRANGQAITYDGYDAMNRLLQQTATQTPDPNAVTKYTYYASGLLHTMQDPRLVANNSSYSYTYGYDQMGRRTSLGYPPDSGNVQRSESWVYDTAGRIDTFTNRAGNVQTFTYDPLNRQTLFSWNDGGVTPSVSFAYDVASRLTSITNANATISHTYFNDNLLNTETTTYADNTPRTVTYTPNADGNAGVVQYPNGVYSFTYNYTGRNQLWKLINNANSATVMTYLYDPDGNLKTRAPNNSTSSTYTYDALDRVTHISHALIGTTRTFDYAYDSVGNRKWTKRDGGTGDVFGYDLNDQSMSALLNVSNPDTTAAGPQTINYDANGNRTTFSAYGSTDTYMTNNLNQYTSRNSSNATYDTKGNMATGVDGSTYAYDSQDRLLTATKAETTDTFKYDGLNRQVSRTVGTGSPVYKIYDGWNLIAEYAAGATSPSNAYLSGAGGLVKNLTTNRYYYQDASGSTSHLADSGGHLLEWYRYDLQGTPIFYNASNTQISASAYSIRHLFTGQQWYMEIGLYDLRNRFYSPDIGRFLQADPIGFDGDASNLYRYAANNPLAYADPLGLFNGGLFWRGVGNVAFGGLSIYGLTLLEGASYGVATPAVVVFGTSAAWSISAGAAQITSSIWGDRQMQQGAAQMPTNISGAAAKMTPTNVGNLLQQAEAAYSILSGIQGISEARNLLALAAAASDINSGANYILDAGKVEQELTNAASTFQNPSLAQNFSTEPFGDNTGLSLQSTGFGVTGGTGGLSAFGFGGVSFPGAGGIYAAYGSPAWNAAYGQAFISYGGQTYYAGSVPPSGGGGPPGGCSQADPNCGKKQK